MHKRHHGKELSCHTFAYVMLCSYKNSCSSVCVSKVVCFKSYKPYVGVTMTSASFCTAGKAYFDVKNIEVDFGFRTDVKTGKFEQFEIFDFGRKLYYQLLEKEAYQSYDMFKPTLKSTLELPHKTDANIDENLSELIYKMIHPDTSKRAEVFTELNEYIAIY